MKRALQQDLERRIDADGEPRMPVRFRLGGSEMPISGSGQFSLISLRHLLTHIDVRPITIVDLREECHGFIDGRAISWQGFNNGANRGLSEQEITRNERRLLDRMLAAAPGASVMSEEEIVRLEGLGYKRFFVTDHHRPSDDTVDQFIRFIQSEASDTWLHFHCLGGAGRTTTFMIMYEMMHHACSKGIDEIMEHHKRIGGRDMYDIDRDNHLLYPSAIERVQFLHAYYEYCRTAIPGRFSMLWSDWLASQHATSV